MFSQREKFRAPEQKELSLGGCRNSAIALGLLGVTIAGCGNTTPEAAPTTNTQEEAALELRPETPIEIEYSINLGTLVQNVTLANGETLEMIGVRKPENPDASFHSPELIIPTPESSEPKDIIDNLYYMRNMAQCIADVPYEGSHSVELLNNTFAEGYTGRQDHIDEIAEMEPNALCAISEATNITILERTESEMLLEFNHIYRGELNGTVEASLVRGADNLWRFGIYAENTR